jgi:Ca2+-binding EF-hand superfamily protein
MHRQKIDLLKTQNPNLSPEEITKIEEADLTKEDLVSAFLTDKNIRSQAEAQEAVETLIQSADKDGNGSISFYEFRNYIHNAIYGEKHWLQSPGSQASSPPPFSTKLANKPATHQTPLRPATSSATPSSTTPSVNSTPTSTSSITLTTASTPQGEHKLFIQGEVTHVNNTKHEKSHDRQKRKSLVLENHAALINYVDRTRKAHDLFKEADRDRTGKVTLAQLNEVFEHEKAPLEWLAAFDKEHDGVLTWEKFRDAMDRSSKVPVSSEKKDDAKAREALMVKLDADIKRFADLFHRFKHSDSDNSPITREQLMGVLTADPSHMGLANDALTAAGIIMKEADPDHTGTISWFAFLDFMRRHSGLIFH